MQVVTVKEVARLFNTDIDTAKYTFFSVWDLNGSTSNDETTMHGPS